MQTNYCIIQIITSEFTVLAKIVNTFFNFHAYKTKHFVKPLLFFCITCDIKFSLSWMMKMILKLVVSHLIQSEIPHLICYNLHWSTKISNYPQLSLLGAPLKQSKMSAYCQSSFYYFIKYTSKTRNSLCTCSCWDMSTNICVCANIKGKLYSYKKIKYY